jgi:hypothetical protein
VKRFPKKAHPLWGHKHHPRPQVAVRLVPPPCDQAVYEDGTPIFETDTIRSFKIEPWVQKIAARSGQKVDWHWAGGRAIVLALGDVGKAREALASLLEDHDRMYAKALLGSGLPEEWIRERLSSMRQYAGFPPIQGTERQAKGLAETGADERAKYTVRLR